MKKRVFAIIFAAVIAMSVVACGGSAEDEGSVHIKERRTSFDVKI